MTKLEKPLAEAEMGAPGKAQGLGVAADRCHQDGQGGAAHGAGVRVFPGYQPGVGETARDLALRLRIDPENHYIRILLEKITSIEPRKFHTFGVISLIYAAELYLEGIGLWFDPGPRPIPPGRRHRFLDSGGGLRLPAAFRLGPVFRVVAEPGGAALRDHGVLCQNRTKGPAAGKAGG